MKNNTTITAMAFGLTGTDDYASCQRFLPWASALHTNFTPFLSLPVTPSSAFLQKRPLTMTTVAVDPLAFDVAVLDLGVVDLGVVDLGVVDLGVALPALVVAGWVVVVLAFFDLALVVTVFTVVAEPATPQRFLPFASVAHVSEVPEASLLEVPTAAAAHSWPLRGVAASVGLVPANRIIATTGAPTRRKKRMTTTVGPQHRECGDSGPSSRSAGRGNDECQYERFVPPHRIATRWAAMACP